MWIVRTVYEYFVSIIYYSLFVIDRIKLCLLCFHGNIRLERMST